MTVSCLEHEKIPNSDKKEFRIKGPKKLFWEAIVGGPSLERGGGGDQLIYRYTTYNYSVLLSISATIFCEYVRTGKYIS